MLLAYLDESYSQRWDDYWIAAIVVPEQVVKPLTVALDQVVRSAVGSWPAVGSDDVRRPELHGYDLYHGENDWRALKSAPRARISVYRQALDAVAAHDVKIIIRGVNTPRLTERYGASAYHPHKIVLGHMLERIDEYATAVQQPALIIADQLPDEVNHRQALWDYQHYSTIGYRSRRIEQIVDTIHFAPSTASRLLQAADLVAFLHGRRASGLDTDRRAREANDLLERAYLSRVHHSLCWWP